MATKRKPVKGKPRLGDGIQVEIDLGTLTPTTDQIARLKAYVENEVLTWLSCDAKVNTPVALREKP